MPSTRQSVPAVTSADPISEGGVIPPPAGQRLDARRVAPGSLVVPANVRADTKIDRTFVSVIKNNGVIVPIIVELNDDGAMEVLDGQRRTLAAVEAGLDDVPVVVVPRGTGEGEAAERERILTQLIVNDHRAELTDTEHADAYKQLALFGMTADAISRKSKTPIKRVAMALDVANSAVASGAMDAGLTLDQAAIVLEFEDSTDDVTALTAAGDQFDHEAARIRQRRTEERMLADAIAEAEAAGATVWTGPVTLYNEEEGAARDIRALFADEKAAKNYRAFTASTHADCPHKAVALEIVMDWVPGTNDRAPRVWQRDVCTDRIAAGHLDSKAADKLRNGGPAGKPEPGTKEADAATAARRLTIANNKLWAPATEVRLAFAHELLARNTPPADWESFVAAHAYDRYQAMSESGAAAKLLGLPTYTTRDEGAAWLKEHPKKGPQLLLALTFAWYEQQPEFAKSGWRNEHAARYLGQLSKWGYTLSELEERVVQGTAQEVTA